MTDTLCRSVPAGTRPEEPTARPALDHFGINCAALATSAHFYDTVLAPLGIRRVMDHGEYHAGYFGAFVRDPDGNNVEVIYRSAE